MTRTKRRRPFIPLQHGAEMISVTATAVTADATGNIYLAGQVTGALDGEPYIGGVDFVVIKFDSDGNHVWTGMIGSTDNDVVMDLVNTPEGIYFTGYTAGLLPGCSNSGLFDIAYGLMAHDGNLQWLTAVGSSGTDVSRAMVLGDDDHLYIGATFGGDFDNADYLAAPEAGVYRFSR